jgi:hypothetical protein
VIVDNSGPGIYYDYGGPLTISGSTLSRNYSAVRVALWFLSIRLHNCILWDNTVGPFDGGPTQVTATHSLIQGGFPGTGNLDADPLFVDPDQGDYHLRLGSPAIDAGLAEDPPGTDLDGNARPCAKEVDMGAYECCLMNLQVGDPVLQAGCLVEVPIYLESVWEVLGLTLGLRHDPEIVLLDAITAGAVCDVCGCRNTYSDTRATCQDGSVGGTLGIVFDATCVVPPGRHEIARFRYSTLRPGTSPLDLVGCLGLPPLEIVVTTDSGSVTPTTSDLDMNVSRGCLMPPRGDVEPNDRINISDPIFLLRCLYGLRACPDCLDVMDANDDGGVDILDPVVLLDYLFRQGSPPPAPFPGCGLDRTEDTLDCSSGAACPSA